MNRIMIGLLVIVSVIQAQSRNKPLYSMFSDNKARNINDLITIIVTEKANATNSATNNSSNQQQSSFNLGQGSGGWAKAVPSFGAGAQWSNAYEGTGTTAKSGSIQTTITAKIVRILDSGNFELLGTKKLSINGEEELINISGEVRPDDITADNTVASSKLANVEISYKGKGPMYDGAKAGIITRLLNWLF
ncbi:MAG: flagellar basal body L-ring protein FlgH [Candidatus Delongbacteria bacterium]|nr:flagellar basal body L-ring protein FlgH [Candidatus Delongbacteria bacterium]